MARSLARLCAVLLLLPTALVALARPAAAAPGFVCARAEGGASGLLGHVTDVRVARHATYDRFVVQFRERRVPAFDVRRQRTSTFVLEGSGRVVHLQGHAGIGVRFDHATAAGSYRGPRRFVPRFPQLREARETGDFEAVYHWGLGVHRNSCIHVFTLRAPARLVVDTHH
jgi:hypothetical protein